MLKIAGVHQTQTVGDYLYRDDIDKEAWVGGLMAAGRVASKVGAKKWSARLFERAGTRAAAKAQRAMNKGLEARMGVGAAQKSLGKLNPNVSKGVSGTSKGYRDQHIVRANRGASRTLRKYRDQHIVRASKSERSAKRYRSTADEAARLKKQALKGKQATSVPPPKPTPTPDKQPIIPQPTQPTGMTRSPKPSGVGNAAPNTAPAGASPPAQPSLWGQAKTQWRALSPTQQALAAGGAGLGTGMVVTSGLNETSGLKKQATMAGLYRRLGTAASKMGSKKISGSLYDRASGWHTQKSLDLYMDQIKLGVKLDKLITKHPRSPHIRKTKEQIKHLDGLITHHINASANMGKLREDALAGNLKPFSIPTRLGIGAGILGGVGGAGYGASRLFSKESPKHASLNSAQVELIKNAVVTGALTRLGNVFSKIGAKQTASRFYTSGAKRQTSSINRVADRIRDLETKGNPYDNLYRINLTDKMKRATDKRRTLNKKVKAIEKEQPSSSIISRLDQRFNALGPRAQKIIGGAGLLAGTAGAAGVVGSAGYGAYRLGKSEYNSALKSASLQKIALGLDGAYYAAGKLSSKFGARKLADKAYSASIRHGDQNLEKISKRLKDLGGASFTPDAQNLINNLQKQYVKKAGRHHKATLAKENVSNAPSLSTAKKILLGGGILAGTAGAAGGAGYGTYRLHKKYS